MAEASLVDLGAVTVVDGVPKVQSTVPLSDEPGDAESFGEVPLFQALGLTSIPYPANDAGKAQGISLPCGGLDGCIVGARDTRTASIVGNAKPGDTILHSTGPQLAAQVQLKEEKRQALLVSKTSDGKTAIMGVDGLNNKATIAIFGYMVEVSEANGINLCDKTGTAGVQIKDGIVSIYGTVVLGGRTPVAPVLSSLTPVVGTAGVGAPTPGVFVGA